MNEMREEQKGSKLIIQNGIVKSYAVLLFMAGRIIKTEYLLFILVTTWRMNRDILNFSKLHINHKYL